MSWKRTHTCLARLWLLNECPGFCLKPGFVSEYFGCASFEFANLCITKSEAKRLLYAIEVCLDPWFLGVSNNGLNTTCHVGPFFCVQCWPKDWLQCVCNEIHRHCWTVSSTLTRFPCTSEKRIFSSSPKNLLPVVLVDHFVYLLGVNVHKKFDSDLLLRTEAIGYMGLMWSLVTRYWPLWQACSKKWTCERHMCPKCRRHTIW